MFVRGDQVVDRTKVIRRRPDVVGQQAVLEVSVFLEQLVPARSPQVAPREVPIPREGQGSLVALIDVVFFNSTTFKGLIGSLRDQLIIGVVTIVDDQLFMVANNPFDLGKSIAVIVFVKIPGSRVELFNPLPEQEKVSEQFNE